MRSSQDNFFYNLRNIGQVTNWTIVLNLIQINVSSGVVTQ